MFPIYRKCFQTPFCVFNIQFFFQYTVYYIHLLFPNSNDVSKRQYFQFMFPIYMEPLKGFRNPSAECKSEFHAVKQPRWLQRYCDQYVGDGDEMCSWQLWEVTYIMSPTCRSHRHHCSHRDCKVKTDLHNDICHFEIVISTKEFKILFIIQNIFKYNGWI